MFTWHENDNATAAAQSLADAVAAALQSVLDENGGAVLAVSGGRSPIEFFKALSQKDLAWANVGITLADERIVPTVHPDSNTALVREYLLTNKASAAEWIPMVEDGKAADGLPPQETVGFALQHYRQPDVLVLGMGGDGHTASLFPQAPQLQAGIDLANDVPLLHTTPVTAPHERVSMTLGAILKTPHIFLAIQGADKKAVFDRAAAAPDTEFPISLILNHDGANCHVYYAK